MAELAKKRKVRGGHRSYVKKLIGTTNELVESYAQNKEERLVLEEKRIALTGKLKTLKELDDEIINILSEDEKDLEADIMQEIEESETLKSEVQTLILKINDILLSKNLNKEHSVASTSSTQPGSSSNLSVSLPMTKQIRLPRLEVPKFSGKVHEWQEFWDGFSSAIHDNANLSEVDKFSYLRGLLLEPARSTIQGFALTADNYKAAVDLLRKRYGKKTLIQRTYINELLNVEHVHNERETTRLRRMYDFVESKFRSLEALEVDQRTYATFVVPSLLEKLPGSLRITLTRGEEHHMWDMEKFLKEFGDEVDLREEYEQKPQREERQRKSDRPWSTMFAGKESSNCAFCNNPGHRHEDCKRVTDIKERKKLLLKYGRCFKCLRKGHLARACKISVKCSACKCEHHKALCDASSKEPEGNSPGDGRQNEVDSTNLHVVTSTRVVLQTAQAQALGKSKRRVRILFDTGSHKSFITARAAASLGLQPLRKEWVALNTFGRKAVGSNLSEVMHVDLAPVGGGKISSLEAIVVPEISQVQNEHFEIARNDYSHLANIWFSDVCQKDEKLEIDILVGTDYLWRFQTGQIVRGRIDEPVALETTLGWVASGPLKYSSSANGAQEVGVHFVAKCNTQTDQLDENVKRMWDLETIGVIESKEMHDDFVENIEFNGSRYSVKLPWRDGHENLPSNYELSLTRLKSQVRKLKKEPAMLEEYDSVITEQIKSGVIEKVSDEDESVTVHYIPHLAVIRKEAKTTKLRVVYDASAKSNKTSVSLNECLLKGPSLNPLLFHILLRFREKRTALVGDIKKAFLSVEVNEADRNFLRFLWLENPKDPNSKIIMYRFCRVVFGLNASPFLLNATLRHHISKYNSIDPEFVRKLLDSFYVDDLVTGEDDSNEAYKLFGKARERMANAGFRLRKWLTNDKDLRDKISAIENFSAKDTMSESKHMLAADSDESYAKQTLGIGSKLNSGHEKVLGLSWDIESDNFIFQFSRLADAAEKVDLTKRNLLSLLASQFDPIGWIGPIIIRMKMLFQDICRENIEWDVKLEGQFKHKWEEIVKHLLSIKTIEISRCIYRHPKRVIRKCFLHGFGDASTKGYCAVVYLVYHTSDGVYTTLLTSKCRVAPLKSLTIPRLELMSAKILAQLMDSVLKALEEDVKFSGSKYWLDSKTALCWIENRGEWKQFVRHRVGEILKLTNKKDWGYCPSAENPADLGSRGMFGSDLKHNKLWWHGPLWLSQGESSWPQESKRIISTPESESEKKVSSVNVMVVEYSETRSINLVFDINRYSSLRKLVRITALVLHFINKLKSRKIGVPQHDSNESKDKEISSALSRAELINAENAWVKAAQADLRQQDNFEQLKTTLNIIEDENGMLRCLGRLENSDLDEYARRPFILPKEHGLTNLVIKDCHTRVHHSGLRASLAELRSRYWVPRARQIVKKLINKCVTCKKVGGKSYDAPPMASLPEFRVRESFPFSKVGVDFAGPLYVKGKTKEMNKVTLLYLPVV